VTPAEPPAPGPPGPSDRSAATPDGTARRGSRASTVALVVATLALIGAIAAPRHGIPTTLVVIVASVAGGSVAFLEQRRPRLGIRPIAVAIGLVLLAAVVTFPESSNDVWSYTMYGRMVSQHDASPYHHVPADFPHDPFDRRVSPIWQHRGSVYGPAFVAYAAGVTFVAGDSVLLDRLLFQLGAALVVVLALWLVWRRTRSPAAVAFLGLHPVFGAIVVNSGQIDAFIGLAILVAAVLAAQRRGAASGFAIALASLVKITSLLALAGIVFWAWRRKERRVAVRAVVTAGVTVAVVYLPFLAGASHVLSGADHMVTPGSPWNLPAQLLVGKDAGRDLAARLLPNSTLGVLFNLSLGLVVLLGVVLAWRWARGDTPDLAVGAATASYAITAEYTLPWYAAWALPVVAARRLSPLAWVIWIQGAVLLAAWKLPTHHTGSVADTVLRGTLAYALPIVLLVAYLAVRPRDDTIGSRPPEPALAGGTG
jgi:hypothetical protein